MRAALVEQSGTHASFVLEHSFACSSAELWPWLTEPLRMQRWSAARVSMRGAFASGVERSVQLRLGPVPLFVLSERICQVEPFHAFEYTGSSLRGHRGRVVLKGEAARTELTWKAQFEAPLPLIARPMAQFVCWQMQSGFARLETFLAA